MDARFGDVLEILEIPDERSRLPGRRVTVRVYAEKVVVGEKFEPRYFNGTYQLYDDGRRSGCLTLQVDDDGSVRGAYYSDKDGRKYEVRGKLGTPKHSIQFTVQLPRSEQTFQGWLFTGDAKAITVWSPSSAKST